MTNELVPLSPKLELVGLAANEAASAFSFDDYARRKSRNTVRNQIVDLASFAEYLTAIGITTTAEALQTTAIAWQGVSWGVVAGFVQWALRGSFATGTISRRLSTIKVYAAMAMQAGAIPPEEYTKMQTVHAYAGKEADRIDQRRAGLSGVFVRISRRLVLGTRFLQLGRGLGQACSDPQPGRGKTNRLPFSEDAR